MSILLAALLASTVEDGLEVYKCRNVDTEQDFVLSFETKGRRVSDIALYVDGVPRLDKDNDTSWRGTIIEGGIQFEYANIRNRSGTTGDMTLVWQSADEYKARLTWKSVTGGGHIFLEEQEQTANCALFVPEASKTQ